MTDRARVEDKHPMSPVRGRRPSPRFTETGPCTGPTGEHEFVIGRRECVFCDRAERIIP